MAGKMQGFKVVNFEENKDLVFIFNKVEDAGNTEVENETEKLAV